MKSNAPRRASRRYTDGVAATGVPTKLSVLLLDAMLAGRCKLNFVGWLSDPREKLGAAHG
jgi:hypothetical protein